VRFGGGGNGDEVGIGRAKSGNWGEKEGRLQDPLIIKEKKGVKIFAFNKFTYLCLPKKKGVFGD